MKSLKLVINMLILFTSLGGLAQTKEIKVNEFFSEERPFEVKLSTDVKKLLAEKKTMNAVDATWWCKFPDSTVFEEPVTLTPRGNFRRQHCYLASLMVKFNANPANKLAPLKKLKFVGGCGKSWLEEQYLFKEYLIYKMYNLLTDTSLKVRLMNVVYEDSKGKVKPYTQYAFLIEDIDNLAKRYKLREKQLIKYGPKGTDRYQTTLVAIFEYMIGNTDWSIPFYHNIKLMVPKSDTNALPTPLAYDFDISGLVDPPYGSPPPELEIESLTQRVYRGFAVPMEDLQPVIDLFIRKEGEIYSLISNFNLLTQRSKGEMTAFLDEFFKTIKDPTDVKNVFIRNARTN